MKKIKIEFTEAQLRALLEMIDTMSGMLGIGSDFDVEGERQIRLLDRALLKHGIKRYYK